LRRTLSNEPIEVTLVSATLSMCAFWKKDSYEKFHDAKLFAREIVDDCLQVRTRADPATKVRGLRISVIFGSLVLLWIHYYKRD